MLSRTTIPGLRTRVSDEDEILPHDAMHRRLHEVRTLLDRQRRVESLLHRQEMPRHELVETLVAKQHHSELTKKLDAMHPADIAYILEALPPEDRLLVWDLVRAERDGEILLEVSDSVRESLIDAMEPKELVAAVEQLDADELADLAPDLPIEVMQDVFSGLDVEEREQLRAAMSYPDDSVGALMDFDMVTVREDVTHRGPHGRLHAQPADLPEGARWPVGRPCPVGGRAPGRGARARDQGVRAA